MDDLKIEPLTDLYPSEGARLRAPGGALEIARLVYPFGVRELRARIAAIASTRRAR